MRGNSTRQSGHEANDEHCWKPHIHKKAASVHIYATPDLRRTIHFGSVLPFFRHRAFSDGVNPCLRVFEGIADLDPCPHPALERPGAR